jgi:thiosulfate/3-mercaptopyruvate sulfurtransferase
MTDTPPTHPGPLATPDWLHRHLGSPGLRIVDLRGREAFERAHVPGSVHADYARGWRVTAEGAPGMAPSAEQVEELLGSLGIDAGTHVVLVAGGANASEMGGAARAHWTLRLYGHDRVSVLQGGFAGWAADPSRPVESGPPPAVERRDFRASYRPELRATVDEVERAVGQGGAVLLDARSAAQFRGEEKSPAARVAGTLPGSVRLDLDRVDPAGDLSLPAGAAPAGVAGQDPVIAFCNTGHSAALAWFVLGEVGGRPGIKLYDGSMSHWTQDPKRPVVEGRE